jgi:dTDP-4-amino-4,6-dideoxygalactose transaminase
MQAAVLRVKLSHLDAWNRRRREIAALYREGLEGVECLTEHAYGRMNYHLFVIRTSRRDELMAWLETQGIRTLIHYPVPINEQQAFPGQKNETLPETVRFAASILSMPMYPGLTDEEVHTVIQAINQFQAI